MVPLAASDVFKSTHHHHHHQLWQLKMLPADSIIG